MHEMKTVKETAKRWNVSTQQVTRYCRDGRLPSAVKEGHSWMIPADACKPTDPRKKVGNNTHKVSPYIKRPLPVGVSDFKKACDEYYYIDKTLLIKEFLDDRPMVSLFTRPRRFGKTLTMDMIRTYFEKSDEDTSVYFKDKKIWECGWHYREYQGIYPVIFLTFKDVKCENWDETYDMLKKIIRNEFLRHKELKDSEKISDHDYYGRIIDRKADENDYMMSLMYLSQMLHEHHDVAPIIIIDEYDTPIQQGHNKDFYEKVILFMRNLFSGGLKDNSHLSYGFLTGILRVAKESIFSGLNNLSVYSVLDKKYSQYFGFTEEEIKDMTKYYGIEEYYDEICTWYDGYHFGKTDIFNPWSVINYIHRECEPQAYWLSTGSNAIIGEILSEANEDIYERLNTLLQGESFITTIDTSVIYPEIRKNPSSIYSFLLMAGYLKTLKVSPSFRGDYICEVALPNREITYVYNKEILERLEDIIPQSTALMIQEALFTNKTETFKRLLKKLLRETVSCFDTAGENFYHGLVLGLCAMLDHRYYISSNRESGGGRYDIQLFPKDITFPGILIELKAAKAVSDDALKKMSENALKQINDRAYDVELKAKGIKTIYKMGVAFSGKKVDVSVQESFQ